MLNVCYIYLLLLLVLYWMVLSTIVMHRQGWWSCVSSITIGQQRLLRESFIPNRWVLVLVCMYSIVLYILYIIFLHFLYIIHYCHTYNVLHYTITTIYTHTTTYNVLYYTNTTTILFILLLYLGGDYNYIPIHTTTTPAHSSGRYCHFKGTPNLPSSCPGDRKRSIIEP